MDQVDDGLLLVVVPLPVELLVAGSGGDVQQLEGSLRAPHLRVEVVLDDVVGDGSTTVEGRGVPG